MDADVFKTLRHTAIDRGITISTAIDRGITISAFLQEAVIEYLKKYGWEIKTAQPK